MNLLTKVFYPIMCYLLFWNGEEEEDNGMRKVWGVKKETE